MFEADADGAVARGNTEREAVEETLRAARARPAPPASAASSFGERATAPSTRFGE